MSVVAPEFLRGWIELGAWGLACVWCARATQAIWHLPDVADLTSIDWDIAPAREASLVVVVPARDEAESIAATLDALLMADYGPLRVLAVDDRSTDATGAILDDYATRHAGRIDVMHVTELPEGWLGKTFAMQAAMENSNEEYVLFTDADVLMSPSILRRAMAYVVESQADHLVVMPTPQVKSRGEGMVLGFLQVMALWIARPWKISDPQTRDSIGVGAFNLVRRDALEELGGLAPQRMAVLEDVTIGWRMKAAGMRQRMAFAPGLILVHWAKGMRGVVNAMTKNLFAGWNFNLLIALAAVLWIGLFWLLPIAGLFWWGTMAQSLVVLCAIGAAYRSIGQYSEVDARYGWLYPVGAAAFVYAIARSIVTVWVHGGVTWRGTLYPLRELRAHNDPFQWSREAKEMRDRERRVRPSRLRKFVDRWKR